MNFFEYQIQARKQSRLLIVAFILVALLIVAAVNFIVLAIIGFHSPVISGVGYIAQPGEVFNAGWHNLLSIDFLTKNVNALVGSSAGTASVIGLASLGKINSLKSGGGKVARDLGGTLVTNDTIDPLRRRLLNVVEEIAVASGVPVPEVYLLEEEPAINAFAAGYSPSDAAVAVTQGCLEKLNRSELQGVIAHEFSHILNGDMRINIRLMGVIFGILVITIVGRKFMSSGRYVRSSRNNGGVTALVMVGLSLMVIGYIGLFFSRWMKAALSRQREYLADASAVQFTREPTGLAGALKKIAAYNHGSYLYTDVEEVSHMLFSKGFRSTMFDTHPPVVKRIKRIEKSFKENEIEQLAKKLRKQERKEHLQAIEAEKEAAKKVSDKSKKSFNPADIVDQIGSPGFERILAAAVLISKLPPEIDSAAHSVEWAPEVLFYTLLDKSKKIRDQQLMIVLKSMGELSENKLSHLVSTKGKLLAEHRVPLLEIVFPLLKRRPQEDIDKIIATVQQLIQADGRIDAFEYLLSKVLTMQLNESINPHSSKLHGRKKLLDCKDQVFDVISILAAHGHDNDVYLTQKAYQKGVAGLDLPPSNVMIVQDWVARLDAAVEILNELNFKDKNRLVEAMAQTVSADDKIITEEHEMFRAVCISLHVPIPLLKSVGSPNKAPNTTGS